MGWVSKLKSDIRATGYHNPLTSKTSYDPKTLSMEFILPSKRSWGGYDVLCACLISNKDDSGSFKESVCELRPLTWVLAFWRDLCSMSFHQCGFLMLWAFCQPDLALCSSQGRHCAHLTSRGWLVKVKI